MFHHDNIVVKERFLSSAFVLFFRFSEGRVNLDAEAMRQLISKVKERVSSAQSDVTSLQQSIENLRLNQPKPGQCRIFQSIAL